MEDYVIACLDDTFALKKTQRKREDISVLN